MSSDFEARMWEKIEKSVERRRKERGEKQPDRNEVERVISNKIYEVLPNHTITFNQAIDIVLSRTNLTDGHEVGRNIMKKFAEKPIR